MPRLVLVRHGRTQWNATHRGQGQTDIPLDDVGWEQARAAGPALRALKPDVVWSSDLSRAADTAREIGLPVTVDPRLREIDLGRYEGLTFGEWEADDPKAHRLWQEGYDVRRGGGETYGEVGVRAMGAVKEILAELPEDKFGCAVIVAHGGTIRAILTVLLELPPSPWAKIGGLGNTCCADVVDIGEGRGWRLTAYGVLPSALRRPGDG